jgi:hypothetical protein
LKPVTPDLSDEEKLGVREHPGVWFDAFAWLEDRAKSLRRADPANAIQCELFRIYVWCQRDARPCNIIGLKSRKEGLSTGATALAYHHLANHTAEGVVIGTDHETSDTLMRMVTRYAENDAFPWGTTFRTKPAENRGVWTHGSVLKRDTAVDPKAGRSSTVQVLVATEVAHWPAAGVRSADETMLSILNSMPDIANLLRIVDSTAAGAAGWFYSTYQGAVTFDQMQAGNVGNGWIKVFEPWHASPLRSMPVTPEERETIRGSLNKRERAGIIAFGWTEEQIKWRRETLATKCGGDQARFDQEYPESEDVAFQTTGGLRFDHEGVARLLKLAQQDQWKAKRGTVQENERSFRFQEDEQNGYVWMIEPPTVGRSYCVFGDFCEGEQATGKDLDAHAVGVLRDAYRDRDGVEHPYEVVATIDQPGGCRWDTDVLAERMRLLAGLFGHCIVVPEANNCGGVVIEKLRQKGVTICRRKHPDHMNPNKTVSAYGFKTTTLTKPRWIEAMAEAVREEPEQAPKFVCRYLPAVQEIATFVRLANGGCAAMPGKHDDWVAAMAIALYVRAFTRLTPPQPQPLYPLSYGSGNGALS